MKIKKKITIKKVAIVIIEGQNRNIEKKNLFECTLKYGEIESKFKLLSIYRAEEILSNLMSYSVDRILDGSIPYYNTNERNDSYNVFSTIQTVATL